MYFKLGLTRLFVTLLMLEKPEQDIVMYELVRHPFYKLQRCSFHHHLLFSTIMPDTHKHSGPLYIFLN